MKKNLDYYGLFKLNSNWRKFILTMKITAVLLFSCLVNIFALPTYSQATKISLHLKDATIEDVLSKIEDVSEFYFLYNNKLIDVTRKVNIEADKEPIKDILNGIFNKDTKVIVYDRQIILTPNDVTSLSAAMQQQKITGTVTDEKGNPLPGVTVLVKGTTTGALTDVSGKYAIDAAPQNATLIFSFMGMTKQEIPSNGRILIDVVLKEEAIGLDEVVVVGYGTVKKKDLTGSVATLGTEKTKDIPFTNVEQILAGQLSGVQVKSVSGEPGAAPQIRIRGIGSISAGVDPLYVIDGLPVGGGSLQMLNSDDIESIDVLKDASATAIYGSRGSNGVIIITTKRGKEGKTKITFDTYFGYQKVEKLPKMMNAMEQAQYTYDGFKNATLDKGGDISGDPTKWLDPEPQLILDVLAGKDTYDENALNAIFRTAPQASYQLGVSGGNENVKYALSGEYLNQDGIILNDHFERYSLRANIDAKLSKRLTLKLNLSPSYTNNNGQNYAGSSQSGIIGSAVSVHNFFPLLTANGDYNYIGGSTAIANIPNPLARLNENINSTNGMQLLGNINLEYLILNGLKFNIMFGGIIFNNTTNTFTPSLHSTFDNPPDGTSSSSLDVNWINEYTLNYNKSFGSHNITALIGFTAQKDEIKANFLESNKYPNNMVPTLSAVSNVITAGTSSIEDWSLLSYLARLNYDFKGKYFVTASIRTDGSSRFGSNNKYGVFPSVGLAWRISDENFLKDMTFLNNLKLRTSYGESGNNNIGNYATYPTINYLNYPMGGVPTGGFVQGQIDNPSLTWEKQKQFNIGLDIAFFKSRLALTVDNFRSRNLNLLLNVNTPLITGFGTALENIGEVKNTGWEFQLSSKNLVGKFVWTTDFNISTYRNEVVKLGPTGDPIYSGNNITKIGQPIGMFYGLIFDGIFMNQAELSAGPIYNPSGSDHSRVGDMRFKDVSGPNGVPDGIINSYDNTIMGNPYPDFYYGMTNNFSYENFTLTVNIQGVYGGQIYDASRSAGNSGRGRVRSYAFNNNYWQSEANPGDGKTQRPNDVPTGDARAVGSQYLDNGTFLRINNITLSYSLSDHFSKKILINSLRFYVTATNPFLFTKFTTFNPDVSSISNPLQPGLEQNDYPLSKGIIIGINAAF